MELRGEAAAPAPPPPEMETEGAPRQETAEATAEESPSAAVNAPAGAPLPEGQKELTGSDGLEEDGGTGRESGSARFRRDGPKDLVTGSNGSALLRRPGAGDVELILGETQSGGLAGDAQAPSARAADEGLAELYRQAARAVRPETPAAAAPQAGQTVRLSEPDSPRQLTVDELDRAVRRDSRRYDGGMTLF